MKTHIGKIKVTLETLQQDKEALGRFLTEDPKVQEILAKCIRAGNLSGRVTKGEIISHLFTEVAMGPKNWLNHDIKDIYGYLNTTVKRFLFLNKFSQRSFMREEYGYDHKIDEHSSLFDANQDDNCKLEERLKIDEEEEPGKDFKALLEKFNAIVMMVWEKNPVYGELLYRRHIKRESLRDISGDFFRRGLLRSQDEEHAYLLLVNKRLPEARETFDAIALKMNYKLRFDKKQSRKNKKHN